MTRQSIIFIFSAIAVIVGIGISYFPPSHNAEAIWALVSAFLGHASRDIFNASSDSVPSSQAANKEGVMSSSESGFVRVWMLLGMAAISSALVGCGALNAYTGAALNAGESGYVGARQNAKSADDMKFIVWADTACALPLGALARNATGNPEAVNAALTACPVANVGIVSAKDGQVQVKLLPTPTPTPPYTPSK